MLLEIVLAKKQTINYVLNLYIDNSRRAIRSNVHDMIEQNAQLTVELSGILMRLNSVRYLRYMSHKHMFELTQRNLRVEEHSRQLQEVMQQVDKVAREREQHDGDPPCRRHEVHPAVHIDRLAVRGFCSKAGTCPSCRCFPTGSA